MREPKYDFINNLMKVYFDSNEPSRIDTVLAYLEDICQQEESSESIYARRVLNSYNKMVSDIEHYSYPGIFGQIIEPDMFFGILLGISNERLDITEL